MTFEVGSDVPHRERPAERNLLRREARAVADGPEDRRGGREETIEDAVDGIEDRLDVGHTPVVIELKVEHVATRAPDACKGPATLLGEGRLLVGAGLEVVEQVELEVIDDRDRLLWPAARGTVETVDPPVENFPGGRDDPAPGARGGEICVLHDQSQHLVGHRAADELTQTGPVPLPAKHVHPKAALDGARDARVGRAALDPRGVHRAIGMSRDRPVTE